MKKALQYIVPVLLSVLLLWYLFKKVNFRDAMEIISHGVDYWWIVAAMVISVFSHIFRAMRWRIQLNALDIHTTMMELTCSVFGCYAMNLVLPRVGELWRCSFVASRSKAHFTVVAGSMVAERLMDTITVLTLTLLTFAVAGQALLSFMETFPVGAGIVRFLYSPWLWICMAFAVLIVWCLLRKYRESRVLVKIRKWSAEIWNGFYAVVKMQGKWKFLLLSAAIWGCYYLQLYVAFYAFDFTRELCHQNGMVLGLLPCLVTFVLSSIGMAVPSNGGLGPWNIAIMFGLAIYGVPEVEGAAFSILQWSGQTVMLIILGIFTAVWAGATSRRSGQHKHERLV